MSKVTLAIRDAAVDALKSVTEDTELIASFEKALLEQLSVAAPKTGGQKKKVRDPNAPKKPLTSYIYYCNEHREKVRQDGKDAEGKLLSVTEASKVLSVMWKKLTDKQKAKYEKLATTDRSRYEKEHTEYLQTSSTT